VNSTAAGDHHKTGRRARPRRGPAFMGALAVVALFASACGGGSSGPGVASVGSTTTQPASSANVSGSAKSGSSGSSAQLLAFAQCMRTRGLPNFPDPTSSSKSPDAQMLGVSPSLYQTAEDACKHLLPNGGQPTQTASPQLLSEVLDFARCMRTHGLPNWPDPTPAPPGSTVPYVFNLMHVQGFDPRSAQVEAASSECLRLTDMGITGPPPFGLERPAS